MLTRTQNPGGTSLDGIDLVVLLKEVRVIPRAALFSPDYWNSLLADRRPDLIGLKVVRFKLYATKLQVLLWLSSSS